MSIIDLLAKVDPTKTNKYLGFMIKMMKDNFNYSTGEDDEMIGNIINCLFGSDNMVTLNEFEAHCLANRIKKNDISKYTSFYELKVEVTKANEIVKLKELEKQTKKVFENDDWLVLIPLSYEAAEKYGSGTKWCITQNYHWQKYITEYKIIYILNKNNNEKFAISREASSRQLIQAWLADDKEISPMLLPLPADVMTEVIKEINLSETIHTLANELIPTERSGKSKKLWSNELWNHNPCNEVFIDLDNQIIDHRVRDNGELDHPIRMGEFEVAFPPELSNGPYFRDIINSYMR